MLLFIFLDNNIMSSAFYPLGMKSYNNHVPQGGYKSWKGSGVFSNPVGITAGMIRPLTNNDPTNNFKTGFGLPRPIKHARKGRGFNYTVLTTDPKNPTEYVEVNVNRCSKSSSSGALVNQMIDRPGSFTVSQINNDCNNCKGIGIISSYYPNNKYLTENPEPSTQNNVLCCNAERKARRRAVYSNTNLKKNYYTTLQQYRQNRCKTYEQRAFNFAQGIVNDKDVKPGSPLALTNTYFANCQPNGEIYDATEQALANKMLTILLNNLIITQQQYYESNIKSLDELYVFINELPLRVQALTAFSAFVNNPYYGVPPSGPTNPVGCKLVVYKPSNSQFANQGAVSSSTRLLKLNVDTITTNANSIKTLKKNKVPACDKSQYRIHQNKTACYQPF